MKVPYLNFATRSKQDMTSLSEILKSLKPSETIFFCGAGISVHSGLPLANQIKNEILLSLGTIKRDIELITNSHIPFELFMEIVLNETEDDRVFDIFRSETPNTNHFMLAAVSKRKIRPQIITTNFDTLIERAMTLTKVSPSCLCKIHGSLTDIKSLAITLKNVANQANVQEVKNTLSKYFYDEKFKNIIFLGYSFSDTFDIIPAIQQMENTKLRAVFVKHNDRGSLSISADTLPYFKRFSNSTIINIHTDEFIKLYWQEHIKEPYMYVKEFKATTYKSKIQDFISNLSSNIKNLKIARMLSEIGAFQRSAYYYSQVKINLENSAKRSIFYRDQGVNLRILKEYEASLRSHRKALSIAKKLNDSKLILSIYNCISVVYEDLGNYPKALGILKKCFLSPTLKRHAIIDEVIISNYARYCFLLNDFSKGFLLGRRALQISRKKGEKRYEGRFLINLGIGYYYKNDYRNAAIYFNEAMQIAASLDDKEGVLLMLNNVSACYTYLGNYEGALVNYERLINMVGYRKLTPANLSNYALALYYTNQRNRAFYNIKKSINEADRLGRVTIMAGSQLVYAKMLIRHKPSLALRQVLQAEKVFKKTKNINRQSMCLKLIGDIFLRRKNKKRALFYFRKALNLAILVWGESSNMCLEIKKDIQLIKTSDP